MQWQPTKGASVTQECNPPVVHIGLDLAWSSRNPSGGAVLVDGNLVAWRDDLGDNLDVAEFIAPWMTCGRGAVVAVDAPLRVPNETGARGCDAAVSKAWSRHKAGVYPANRRLVAYDDGAVRGEVLVSVLRDRFGFVERAPVIPAPGMRSLVEVFPHAAHVSLFGLDERLRYKAKRGWDYALRWGEFRRYQALLAELASADPPLYADDLLMIDPAGRRGKRLKALEDELDALTCAYVANYCWRHGAAGQYVYGSVEAGHIVVPRPLDYIDSGAKEDSADAA